MEFLLLLSRREHIPEPAENYWKTFFTPVLDSQTVQIIHKLKEAGYRCVCGTNTIDVHYEYHLTHGQYDCFDAVYASHLMGQIKPDITFWYAILGEENRLYRENKSKLKFGDMLFFDDNRDNVAAAASLGIQSYLFTTAGKAAAEISSATGPAL
jgi:putative hydrolase of the HAD superfamily